MTELLDGIDTPSDAELISRVRGGDLAAYGDLFERHVAAARRLSRQLVRGPDADDLVSDAFTKVMSVLQGGGGPDVAFRAYLLTAVRRLHVDKIRAQSRLTTSDDMEQFDPGLPFHDTAVAGFESGAAAKAFASLPERWQLVLWHLEVEGQKPAEIAPLLGMSANSVSALAYRAREGLRQAFLTAHLADTPDTDCRWVNEHLGAYVRQGLSRRDTAKVEAHLDECRRCTAMYLELNEVNSNLSAIIAPLLLGGAAAGYLASAGSGAAAGGVLLFFDRAKDAVLGNLGTVAAGTAVAGVAAVAAVAVAMGGGGGERPQADPPVPSISQAPPTATSQPPPTQEPTKPPKSPPTPTQVPPPVVEVVDPPETTTPTANISVASASISDDAVVLDVDGLPADQVIVSVDLRSESGLTTFRAQNDACSVKASDTSHAECVAGSGSGGDARLLLAPTRFQAVIPLAYPESLSEDRLSVTVSVIGYDDPAAENNSVTLTFTPPQTPPPPPTPTADLHLALAKVDETHVRLTVKGVPANGPTLVFDADTPAGVTLTGAPSGCSATGSGFRCEDPDRPFTTTFGLSYDPKTAPVSITLRVSAAGVEETAPRDNSDTISIGTKPVPTADLALGISGNQLGNGTGRFRATVDDLTDADSPDKLRIQVRFDNPDVDLEDIPIDCVYVDAGQNIVECDLTGDHFTGVFDADLRELGAKETVGVTVTVSPPAGVLDPNLDNNTKSFDLGLNGVTGLLALVIGEDTPLEPVGKLVDDLLGIL